MMKEAKQSKKTQQQQIADAVARIQAQIAGENLTRQKTLQLIMRELGKVNCVDLQLLYQKTDVYAHDIPWLAEESGINYYTLNKKMQGKAKFTAEEIARLYVACDMSREDVYSIFIHPYQHLAEQLLLELYTPQTA